jgi:hypothetical protein
MSLAFVVGWVALGQPTIFVRPRKVVGCSSATHPTRLTRNVRDFDLLNQIAPEGRVLFHERMD